jgi:hypothetical protein
MTSISFQTIDPALQMVPVALVFSTQLLLPQKSSATVKADFPPEKTESLTVRASSLTATLKGIPGYNHGGLNE